MDEQHEAEKLCCSDCGEEVTMLWNLGRCLSCHENSALCPLAGDCLATEFEPAYAGEAWGPYDY